MWAPLAVALLLMCIVIALSCIVLYWSVAAIAGQTHCTEVGFFSFGHCITMHCSLPVSLYSSHCITVIDRNFNYIDATKNSLPIELLNVTFCFILLFRKVVSI